jgi:lipopolysaccharide export system protein LptA
MSSINNYTLRVSVTVLLFIAAFSAFAQNEKGIQVKAESMKSLIREGQQVARYLGNVNILHQGTVMTCDSAYLTKKLNVVEAFSHVVVTKEESKLYGDFLYYDGNTSTGKVSGKEVKMIQKDASLVTDVIYFDTKLNSAHYLTYGILKNIDNTLKSKRGYYFSKTKKYYFAGSVEMQGKDGSLNTDSLEYGTQDEVVYFYGPTRIYNKESYVYCEKGWSNRKNDQSNFFNNALIEKGAQKLYGQDVFYDKRNGYAKIVGQVAMVDTTQKVTVYGGRANYWDIKKEAEVLDNPLLVMASKDDTLFLKAEKFLVNTFLDSSLRDSTYRIVKAIKSTKFYKRDLQGVCDSLIYNTKDSTISLFVSPVLWSETNQLTADFIKAYTTTGNKLRKMDFEGTSFITSQEDSVNFNQIRGKTMFGYFTDGKLSKLDVKGNGQAVKFLRDEGIIAAVNKAESSDLIVRFKENTISKISFIMKPVSTFYPIKKVDYEEITLKDFRWLDDKRPKSKLDIIPKGLNLVLTDAKPWFKRDIVKSLN